MSKRIYTVFQIELIQKELKNAYKTANKEEGLSWKGLARSVEEFFLDSSDLDRIDIPLPFRKIRDVRFHQHDNLRKFANGESKSMEDIKLVAVSYWLMNENICWSGLTKEKLFGVSTQPKIALLFSDFLHDNSDEKPFVSADMIMGEFFLKMDGTEISLSIYSKITEYVFSITVYEKNYIEKRSVKGLSCESEEKNYEGWLVLAPNDGLFCILQNHTDKCNHIYIPLALDEGVLEKKPISYITFLNQPTIDHLNFSNMSDVSFLDRWVSNNSHNIMIFQREK